jgi:hypothetical protein
VKKLGMTVFMAWLGMHSQAFAVTINDLKIQCSGHLKIEHILSANYSPGLPAHGRFGGTPATETIVAQASVIQQAGDGCALLLSKYKIDLQTPIQVHIGVHQAIGQTHVESVAKSITGSEATFTIGQYFDYQTENGSLPLFPEIAAESIYLSGIVTKTGDHLAVEFPIDVASIYNLIPVKQWSDEQKVVLAHKLEWLMGDVAKLMDLNDFHRLFLGLDMQSPKAKKVMMQIIWHKFNEGMGQYSSNFFEFEVGGAGSFAGQPFAKKLNQLANEVATKEEIKMLVYQFPTLLVPGSFTQVECLNLTTVDMHQILQQWQTMYPTFMGSQAAYVQRILELFKNDQSPDWSYQCIANLQKDGNKEFAQDILKDLKD